jgi:hypothetical protein
MTWMKFGFTVKPFYNFNGIHVYGVKGTIRGKELSVLA